LGRHAGALIANRADVAFSGISITEKRKQTMDFSDVYMINTLVIAAMADRGVRCLPRRTGRNINWDSYAASISPI
jgi:hypothetical protein